MPLIIKSLSIDAASFAELSDDENDFVKDPEQIRDQLPLPFRMIEKVLSNLLDDAWQTIVNRENKRIEEKSKVRPPRYDCGINVYALKKISCLCESSDGRYIFSAFYGGVHVVEASSRRIISSWNEANTEITQMQCVVMGVQGYLLATLDILGVARLLACIHEQIYLLKSMSDEVASRHSTVTKCETSKEGDFLGLLLENVHTKESSLEVLQLPRDAWLRELEELYVKSQALQPVDMPSAATTELVATGPKAGAETSAVTTAEVTNTADEMTAGEPKFSQPMMVLRARPQANFAPNAAHSAAQAFKEVNDNKVILLGTGTLLTRAYAEVRKEMFQEANAKALSYLPNQHTATSPDATFHFLTPGVTLPYGIDQPGILSRPTSIAVWWSGSNQMLLYCLIRPPKAKKTNEPTESEFDLKPEVVWPLAAKISTSCMTDCSSIIAIGLENGVVIVWDKQLGSMRKCMHVSEHPITKLEFLNPSICSQSNNEKRWYPTTTSFHVLVTLQDSSLHLLNCGLMDQSPSVCIHTSAKTDDEVLTQVRTFPGLPEIVLNVHKNGAMFLQDVTTASLLCEVALPVTHELATPWQPVIAVAAFGQMLYVKGQHKSTRNSQAVPGDGDEAPVFVFQLRSFPTLDKYWKKKRPDVPYTTCSTSDIRVSSLLAQKVKSSGARKQRLEDRWSQMKQELARINLLKQAH